MVEAWGRGMPLILNNVQDVEFREVANIFIAKFGRPSFAMEKESASREAINRTIDKTIDKTIYKDLSSTETAIVELIKTSPTITQKEMAAQLNLSEVGIRYNTDKLKTKGILKRTGGKKAGKWVLSSP